MEIKRTTIEKIRIEGIERSRSLDPVEVIVENFEEGRGKITISCYGEVWTGFWGSMGGTVEQFFQRVSNDYLIGKMSDYQATVPDTDSDQDFLRRLVLKERRCGNISKQEAHDALFDIGAYGVDRNSSFPVSLLVIEGLAEPWYLDWPKKPNHKYKYLSRILDLVREVIKPEGEGVAPTEESSS